MPDQPTNQRTFKVRAGSNGEYLITGPSGRVQFMRPFRFFWFCLSMTLQGYKVEEHDNA